MIPMLTLLPTEGALPTAIMIGQPRHIACEGRCCADRTAPVFLSYGVRGLFYLCAACRDWQSRLARQAAGVIRRGGR